MDHSPSRKETGDPEGERIRFDPYVAAAVLRKLSELVAREMPSRLMDPAESLFQTAIGILTDAKAWLEQYRTPFEYFAGDLLLVAASDRLLLIGADTFASTLASAALELVTIARLLELRDRRTIDDGRVPRASVEESPQLPSRMTEKGDRRFP